MRISTAPSTTPMMMESFVLDESRLPAVEREMSRRLAICLFARGGITEIGDRQSGGCCLQGRIRRGSVSESVTHR
jgi:hypothetical protein